MPFGLASDELPAGEGLETSIRRVRVGDGHVLVARLGTGEVVAFSPVCPHQFTELDEATVRDGTLRCPRHGYLYDTRSGENVHPGREAKRENLWKLRPGYLPCFSVVERDGWITVSDQPCAPPESFDPALEGPPAPSADLVTSSACGSTGPSAGPSAGASSAPPPAPVPVAPPPPFEQSVKFLTVRSGANFDVRLPIIPHPGFSWQHQVTGDLLAVIGEEDEPGYSPCHLLQMAAVGAGAASLTCTYANEDGDKVDVRTFIIRVQPA